jgi:hypothetical protein
MFRILVCSTVACFCASHAAGQDTRKIVTVNPFDGQMIVAPSPVPVAESPKPSPPEPRSHPAQRAIPPVDGPKKNVAPAQSPAPDDRTLAANTPTGLTRPLPNPVLPMGPVAPKLQFSLIVPEPGFGNRTASAEESFHAQDRFWLQVESPVSGRLQIAAQTRGDTPKVIFPFDDLPAGGDYIRASETRLFPPEDRWSFQFDERPGDICLIVLLLPAEPQIASQVTKLSKEAYPKSVQISPLPAFSADVGCSFILKQLPPPHARVDGVSEKVE